MRGEFPTDFDSSIEFAEKLRESFIGGKRELPSGISIGELDTAMNGLITKAGGRNSDRGKLLSYLQRAAMGESMKMAELKNWAGLNVKILRKHDRGMSDFVNKMMSDVYAKIEANKFDLKAMNDMKNGINSLIESASKKIKGRRDAKLFNSYLSMVKEGMDKLFRDAQKGMDFSKLATALIPFAVGALTFKAFGVPLPLAFGGLGGLFKGFITCVVAGLSAVTIASLIIIIEEFGLAAVKWIAIVGGSFVVIAGVVYKLLE